MLFVICTLVATLHSCHNFASVLHENALVFSQLETRNFLMYTTYIYIEIGKKNKETILSSLQVCFVVTHLSGDFIVKNIRNHRCIYNLQICIIGVAVNLNVSVNCYAVTLCFCGGTRTRVHYVY